MTFNYFGFHQHSFLTRTMPYLIVSRSSMDQLADVCLLDQRNNNDLINCFDIDIYLLNSFKFHFSKELLIEYKTIEFVLNKLEEIQYKVIGFVCTKKELFWTLHKEN